jgi:hypothetical protein
MMGAQAPLELSLLKFPFKDSPKELNVSGREL